MVDDVLEHVTIAVPVGLAARRDLDFIVDGGIIERGEEVVSTGSSSRPPFAQRGQRGDFAGGGKLRGLVILILLRLMVFLLR